MKTSFLTILLSIGLISSLSAQEKYTVSGYLYDKSNGETLIGASVTAANLKATGTFTNVYGFYSLTLPKDTVTLIFNYLGYKPVVQKFYLDKNIVIKHYLEPQAQSLQEVVVVSGANTEEVEKTQMSKITIPIKDIKQMPVLFGEVDIMKTLQLLPGIKGGTEGNAGFYVRGGGPDQNLILLDEAIVYNASHLFGFFSVFNSDAIKDIEIYKGGFPSRFGGRLSSVLDIKMKEGNDQKFKATGGIGSIASRLTLEGPIKKGKSSFIISARRTYIDVFMKAYNKSQEDKPNPANPPLPIYHFYDLNAKFNIRLGEKDRLFISAYLGNDIFNFDDASGLGFKFNFFWGNATSTVRWNRVISPKLFVNTTFIYSKYDYRIENTFSEYTIKVYSKINDINLKTDFDYYPNPRHNIKYGAQYIYHTFTPSALRAQLGTQELVIEKQKYGTEMGAYISDDYELSSHTKINIGARLSGFVTPDKTYGGLEPRFSIRQKFRKNTNLSLKAGYARMYQYLHLISNSAVSLPTDIWYPTTSVVKPQISDQVALGVTQLLFKKKLVFTYEVYYKWMQNQIDYKQGAQLFLNPDLENDFTFGRGWSYGNELLFQKNEGKLTGWVGYTLSWTNRLFKDLNNGNPFPAKYDRRHDISVVAIYKLSKRINLSGTFVYATGNALTLPTSRYYINDLPGVGGSVVPAYSARNEFRMPSYHRADLGMVYKFLRKKYESDISFSVYNVYNRQNAFLLYLDEVKDANNQTVKFVGKQLSLFPIIPAITYNFKF
jgi:hypothetical protein